MIRLTEEEIGFVIRNSLSKEDAELGDYTWAVTDTDKAIAQAQIKKLYDWGMETCPHYKVNKGIYNPMKRECEKCWTELKGE
jgi:hypothetical protein